MAFSFGQGISGNFANTSVGLAQMVLGGVDVGFLKESLKCVYDMQTLDFEVGTPLQFAGRTVIKYSQEVMAGLAELSANTIAACLGSNAAALTAITAGATSWPPTGVTNTINWVTLPNGATGVQLLGGSVSAVVVKTPNGTTATYVLGTDYYVEPGTAVTNGQIIVKPGSSLATAITGGAVTGWVSYSFSPYASQRIYPARNFAFVAQDCLIRHTRPNNNKLIKIYMPSTMAKGRAEFDFAESKYIITQFALTAIPVPGYVDELGNSAPYGFIDFQV